MSKFRGGRFSNDPSVAGSNTTAMSFNGVNREYIGFRLVQEGRQLWANSTGNPWGIDDPRYTWIVPTRKNDHDHHVGFRLVWNKEGR